MIIVADSDARTRLRISYYLFRVGVLSLPCTIEDIEANFHPTMPNAVLITDADHLSDPYAYGQEMRAKYPLIPFIVLREKSSALNLPLLRAYYADVLPKRAHLRTIVDAVMEAILLRTGRDLRDVIAGRVRSNLRTPYTFFCGAPFRLDDTGRLIVRYLILAYPRIVPAQELLHYCFDPRHTPSLHNVTAQVYRVNRVAQTVFRQPIVFCKRNVGYYVALPRK